MIFALLFVSVPGTYFYTQSRVFRGLHRHRDLIEGFCQGRALNSRTFASVIYAERRRNINVWDRYDEMRAELGHDSSVGFSQIKVSTAVWIQAVLEHRLFLIEQEALQLSSVVKDLCDDSLNIHMAGTYLCYMIESFQKKHNRRPSAAELATLYSRGVDYSKNIPLEITLNALGRSAEEYYDGSKQLDLFPRMNLF